MSRLRVAFTGRREIGRRCRRMFPDDVQLVSFDEPAEIGFSIVGTRIFRAEEIEAIPLGIINLHLAPLPRYRGRYSFTHAILAGDTTFGVTLHYIEAKLDAGSVIAERLFPMSPRDTAWALYLRAQRQGTWLVRETLPRILDAARRGERVPSAPQDEAQAQYFDRFSLPALTPETERALSWR